MATHLYSGRVSGPSGAQGLAPEPPAGRAYSPWVAALLAWDGRMLRRIHGWSRPGLDPLMRTATWLGNSLTWWFHTALIFVLFDATTAALLGGGSGAAAIVAQGFKRTIRRRRPNVGLDDFEASAINPDRYSFPSGHTCGAVGGAVAVYWSNPELAAAYGGLAGVIAFSRMYLGAHYPLDVLGGALIGALSGWLSAEVIVRVLPELMRWFT